jgi:hypothetical protein
LDDQCLAAELLFDECVLGLTCEEFSHLLEGFPEPYPCQEEQAASCQEGNECSVGVGVGENEGECSVTVSCEGEPEQSVECDGMTCTCFLDGFETGGCADPLLVCGDPGSDSLAACCA